MAKLEIERKWSFITDPTLRIERHVKLKDSHVCYQWYIIATDDAQVRVTRRIEKFGDKYTLNIKTGNGLTRKEVQFDIPYSNFLKLIGQCDEAEPIKKRLFIYKLPNGKELEISKVDDSWWYAEVEFDNEQQAEAFEISNYIRGEIADRTGDPHYAMKNYWRRTRM